MFPLRSTVATRRRWVTVPLILVNSVLLVWELSLPPDALVAAVEQWGFTPSVLSPVTPLTSQFLHGGLMHVLGNMLFLWVFGPPIEANLGSARFLLFYLGGGLAAAGVQWAADPSSAVPMIGASGAVSAVLGAYFAMHPRTGVETLVGFLIFWRKVTWPALLFLGLWFLQNLAAGVFGWLNPTDGGVAWWAHVGGFVMGAVVGLTRR
jgi:membrane associated rhomboid family serine protease